MRYFKEYKLKFGYENNVGKTGKSNNLINNVCTKMSEITMKLEF